MVGRGPVGGPGECREPTDGGPCLTPAVKFLFFVWRSLKEISILNDF
jgi:hypothetical protein